MPDFELGKFQRVQKWINENKNFFNLIIQGTDLT